MITIKLGLSLHNKAVSKRVWGTTWISWGKYCKVQKFSRFNREKIWKVDKDCNEDILTISCEIKFNNSARFMTSSLSNPVDNLTEGIHKIDCKNWD